MITGTTGLFHIRTGLETSAIINVVTLRAFEGEVTSALQMGPN
jgi:hypothetical protein